MITDKRPVTIVIADDDEDDCMLLRQALQVLGVRNELRFVEDGEQLLDYLRGEGRFGGSDQSAHPDLILLDLNMPIMDGRAALAELKTDPDLCHIPVVILTTSGAERDVRASYRRGANSFITKPATFQGLVDAMRELTNYWFGLVELP